MSEVHLYTPVNFGGKTHACCHHIGETGQAASYNPRITGKETAALAFCQMGLGFLC